MLTQVTRSISTQFVARTTTITTSSSEGTGQLLV